MSKSEEKMKKNDAKRVLLGLCQLLKAGRELVEARVELTHLNLTLGLVALQGLLKPLDLLESKPNLMVLHGFT